MRRPGRRFRMRLAMRLGMTLDELGRRMSSRELSEWMAFDSIEPIDSDKRAELSAGIIASTLANCHLKRGAKALRPVEFMPDWDGTRKASQSADEMLQIAQALAQSGYGCITTGG